MVNFEKFNRHWENGFFYPFEKKRAFFGTLQSYLGKKQIVALTGVRRTGKTVLLKQVINHLINSGIERKNILYFSFDEQKPSLDELIGEYLQATSLDIGKDKTFIFLDEIQKLGNWQEQVKTYYDNYENIRFFVSGSSTLFISKKSHESLAGRIFILDLPVLSFREFLEFRGKKEISDNPKMFPGQIQKEFASYLKRNFIDIINEDDESAREYLQGIINKVAFEDIPQMFSIENPEKLKALITAIYSSPGMLINYENLGNDLALSSKTAEKYLFYLTQAKIVKKIYNYSKNFLTSEKKSKKAYITAPCMCFLNDEADITKIVENTVCIAGNYDFFWRTPQKDEIDFISKKGPVIIPIEVKYSNTLHPKDFNAIKKFSKKNKINASIIITKEKEGANQTTKTVPAWKWLLEQQ
ncbi:MAG TPA: ATP-binding protein [Candidatus Diapherotrites archaeon]|uniref:ATP-binding protein n=1 Tax=Candidatus Iainarchaeum sp. TaxID=3101447 RepID=A0A7J4IUK0_9ARCH|nr:ATP-binding protein [Candidatus Diapherotrites archaeon]